jgi:CDP-4-dehydro-6-deoxyglucose reductase
MSRTLTLSPSGKKVPCQEGQTILAALEKNGYVLPNNCRAGACGECKLKVLKGQFDQGFILDMALSRAEREEGFGLMCMAKPTSDDLELVFETNNSLPKLYPPQEDLPFIVLEKSYSTSKIMKLRLRTLGVPMKFWPGQFITLGCSEKNIPKRSYSIANSSNLDGEITLYISKVAQGLTSQWIHENLKIGEVVSVSGPYGTFIGDPQCELPVLCLASGSGLAPIMSLASAALLRGGFRYPATILFSAKTKSDLFELGFFKFLEVKFRNFKFVPTLTQEKDSSLKEGRIPELLPKLYPNLQYYSLYIAGSPDFVQECRSKAIELGAREEFIHVENFFSGAELT